MAPQMPMMLSLKHGDIVECGACGCMVLNDKKSVAKHNEWHAELERNGTQG